MFNFLKKYKYIFIIITLVVIFSISYFNYQNAKLIIEESYQKKRDLVEYNIVKSLRYLNDSLSIVEKQLNQDMGKAKIEVFYPELRKINIYTEAEELIDNYQSVEEISFYKYSPETGIARKLSSENEAVYVKLSPSEVADIRQVFEEQKKLNVALEEENYSRSYLPVFSSGETGSWWDTFVVGIKYNNNYMMEEIIRTRNLFLINALIMLVVFVIFTSSIVYLLRRFEYMAYHDSLTGLANRTLFSSELKANLDEEKDVAVILADINDFEEINARFGHEVSDLIIEKAAVRLNKTFTTREEIENICRIGGVKFAAAFSDFDSQAVLEKAVEEIIAAFNKPLEIGENKFFISLTLGISIYPRDGKDIETLFKKADYALYKAKNVKIDYLIYDE